MFDFSPAWSLPAGIEGLIMANGAPGRPAKPTNLKVLHGDRQDRVNDDEPQPAEAAVVPPEWLDAAALAVWNRLAPDLIRSRVLTAWDVDAFAVYCDAVVRHAEAAELVAEAGALILGDKERLVKNPAAQLVRDYSQIMNSYGGQFGLTPSARAGISNAPDGEKRGAERLLSG